MANTVEGKIDCARCGSYDLVRPYEGGDGSTVTCNACGAEVGTWGALQAAALRKLERATRYSMYKEFRGGL
jgi:hypothetical protein